MFFMTLAASERSEKKKSQNIYPIHELFRHAHLYTQEKERRMEQMVLFVHPGPALISFFMVPYQCKACKAPPLFPFSFKSSCV